MAQWTVTRGGDQFSVDTVGELINLARRGDLKAGDMIQPPGATDWVYAGEVPELRAMLSETTEEVEQGQAGAVGAMTGAALAGVVAVALVGIIAIGGVVILYVGSNTPTGDQSLVGDGGLTYSQMIVTAEGASLVAEPAAGARPVASVTKNGTLDLLAKRDVYYKARIPGGAEGWIRTDQVLPMYQLGAPEVRQEFDPLYNPDRYVEVDNARWMQLPGDRPNTLSNNTIFEFAFRNNSPYPMTDLVVLATIQDSRGQELERAEIAIEGQIPPRGVTMVGSLASDDPAAKKRKKRGPDDPPPQLLTTWTFERMAAADPDLQLQWSDGVQIEMKSTEFDKARIDILEVRAVPDAKAADAVSKRGR